MSFPYAYKLRRPNYSYSTDGLKSNSDKLRGLLVNGPLRPTKVMEPKCLFIFHEGDRDRANHLYLSLRNGIAKFPGCKRLLGLSLERTNVEAITVSEERDDHLARSISDAIQSRLEGQAQKPDFAFILHLKQFDPSFKDPYHAAKTALYKFGIPSQYVSWELLDSQQQFGYAISNIALSFFVKLGGIPWSIRLEKRPTALVFGIGHVQTHALDKRDRQNWIGYATCVLSNGIYQSSSFFPPAKSYKEFLSNLRIGLKTTLDKVLLEQGSVERVTIHVSRLEREEVFDVVNEAMREYSHPQKLPILSEVVKLTSDSDFSVFDLADKGYVSEEGTVIALDNNHALLVTEGRREAAVWRGRKPVTLEITRQYKSSGTLNIKDTIEDAFYLSSVNWRGFNAITQPISLQYSKLIADQIAKISKFDPQVTEYIEHNVGLNSVPWFI